MEHSSTGPELPDSRAAEQRKHEYEQAVATSTKIINSAASKQEQVAALQQRCTAHARWSQNVRNMPATIFETGPVLSGLDAIQIAELAVKDAQRAVELDKTAENWFLLGNALSVAGRYADAQSALMEGMAVDPTNTTLQAALAEVSSKLDLPSSGKDLGRTSIQRAQAIVDHCNDLECVLCMKLFYQPVTTPCGHTFCKGCYTRLAKFSNITTCPICRTVLHVGAQLPVSVVLKAILEKSFPAEYEARRQEEEALELSTAGVGVSIALPLFVMCTILPGEKMCLNIFEPRYRLLVRRCMEGNRRFGMAQASGSGVMDVAGEVEIMVCQPQNDGRFYLEVVGRRRVKLTDVTELDGYRMAMATELRDLPVDPSERTELVETAQVVEGLAVQTLQRVAGMARGPARLGPVMREIEGRVGEKPPSGEFEELSYWVGRILVNMPHYEAGSERVRLLQTTSTLERLRLEQQLLTRRPQGCCFM